MGFIEVATTDSGVVWSSRGDIANGFVSILYLEQGAAIQHLGEIADSYTGLRVAGDGLVTKDTSDEGGRLVELDLRDISAGADPITSWRADMSPQFWTSPDGQWSLWHEARDIDSHPTIVVQHGDVLTLHRLPGPTDEALELTPDGHRILYRKGVNGRLGLWDLNRGAASAELDDREFHVASMSSQGILAAASTRMQELCVIDVSSRT